LSKSWNFHIRNTHITHTSIKPQWEAYKEMPTERDAKGQRPRRLNYMLYAMLCYMLCYVWSVYSEDTLNVHYHYGTILNLHFHHSLATNINGPTKWFLLDLICNYVYCYGIVGFGLLSDFHLLMAGTNWIMTGLKKCYFTRYLVPNVNTNDILVTMCMFIFF